MFKFCSLCSLSFYSPCFEFSNRLHSGTSQLFLQTTSAINPVSPWKLLKVCPFTLSLVSPLQTCSACECMGCGTNLALTWHSGLVLSIKATLVKPPFSADSDIMRAFIIVSDTLIKGLFRVAQQRTLIFHVNTIPGRSIYIIPA